MTHELHVNIYTVKLYSFFFFLQKSYLPLTHQDILIINNYTMTKK